jgi:hypothetical protein
VRLINLDKLGTPLDTPGCEDDWQTRRRPDGTLWLANRCVTLVPAIPAEKSRARSTPSAMYKPEWIQDGLFWKRAQALSIRCRGRQRR